MTEPKRFKRGKHTYTNWGHNFKEVRIEGKPKEKPAAPPQQTSLSIDIDSTTDMGVYSNLTMVHKSPTEVILDFIFLQPGRNRGRLRSRVILSPKQAKKLSALLEKSVQEDKE